MKDVLLRIDHRTFRITVKKARQHWRQYRHGPQHDSDVVYRWAWRWLKRSRSTLTSDPVMEFSDSHGQFFMRSMGQFQFDFRCIYHGQDFGLGERFMVDGLIGAIRLDVPNGAPDV